MKRSKKLVGVILDLIKLVLIFAVCLIIALVGSYLLAVLVGLVPKDSEYYRPLSVDTVLNNLPFIGTNMIYIIAFLVVLGIITAIAWGYDRYKNDKDSETVKPADAPGLRPEAKQ